MKKNRHERRKAQAAARQDSKKQDDTPLRPRELRMGRMQEDMLEAIARSGAVGDGRDPDIAMILEAMSATMIPFAIMHGYEEEEFVAVMRELYRMIYQVVKGEVLEEPKPSLIIVPPGQA